MDQLDSLQPGDIGRIVDINGDDAIAVRLMEMGLTDGEEIAVIGFAPLGDPVECRIRGYRISLRRTEAQRVIVERIQTLNPSDGITTGETP